MANTIKQKKLDITFHNPNSKEDTEKTILSIISEILSENILQKLEKNIVHTNSPNGYWCIDTFMI
mgnify:CR=1 FL=1